MSTSLKVLIVEDEPNDAELIVRALRRGGFDPLWQRVETEEAYLSHLHVELDLILADYSLPQFSGLRALYLLRERKLDIPFIVVTGSLEEVGIEAMRAGAADYLLKDRLGRLGEAVRRALEERILRQEKRLAESRTQAFLGLGQQLSTAVTAEEAARVIMDVADQLLGWDACTLDLYVPEQDVLEPVLTVDTIEGQRVNVPPAYRGKPSQIARRVLNEGAQLILRDPEFPKAHGLIPFGNTSRPSASLMFAPVHYGEHVTGILSIQSYTFWAYDEASLDLLQALADHCGGALDRIQAEARLHEQRAFAQALADTAAVLNSTLDLSEVLDRILQNVERVVRHDGTNIMLVEAGTARVVGYRGTNEQGDSRPVFTTLQLGVAETESLRTMVESGHSLVIPDTGEYPGWRKWPGTEWIRSYVGAPIQRDGEVIGFLNLYSAQVNFFTAVDAERLQALADQMAIAIKNAQLFEAEQRQRHVETTLRQAAAVLNSSLAPEEVLGRILDQLAEVIPHDSASVQRLEGQNLVVRAVRGFEEPARITGLAIPVAPQFPNADVVINREPLSIANVAEKYPHFRDEPEVYAASRVRSWLGVPMIINDQVIGMITLDRNEVRPYTSTEIELAVAFANHAAIALQNARLYEELETYSDILEQAVEKRTAELKRTMERSEAILQNNPDAVLLLSAEGTVEMGNRAFHQIFGYPMSEAYDRLPTYLFCPSYRRNFTRALYTVIRTARTIRFEAEVQRKDGMVFDADVALAPIREKDAVIGMVCSLRDISGLKEVERMKDAFVSNVSHELRSPITSVKLYRDLLALNPGKQSVYLERLGREIDRLHVVVEDLLRLSRLDQEPVVLNPKPVDLNELTAEYVDDRTPLAESKGLTLLLEQDLTVPPVPADQGLLGQVLSILLTNAFNYTPSGGRIIVQTRATHFEGKDWAGFSVSDTGPGIPLDEQPYLFDRFYRGQAGKESSAPGTGLGLSITKEIVERHKGRIELFSEGIPGQGASFTIWLPVQP